MPDIIRCPSCQSPLRLPDAGGLARATLRCPKCKQRLGPAATPPTPPAPPPAAPQGIPVGILVRDDGIVVPLAPHERVRHPDSERPKKPRKKRRSRRPREPEAPPLALPATPPPSAPSAAVEPRPAEGEWSADVELVPELDARPVPSVELPVVAEPVPTGERPELPKSARGERDVSIGWDSQERGDIQDWQSARTGLLLTYLAGCLVLGAADLGLAGTATAHVLRLCGVAASAGIMSATLFLAGIVSAGAGLLLVAGQIFCSFAPSRTGAQVLAAASAGLLGLSFFSVLVGDLMGISGSLPLFYGLIITGAALAAAQPFFFLAYLRMLALALSKRWLAHDLRKAVFFLMASLAGYALFTAMVAGVSAALFGRPARAEISAVRDTVDLVRAVGLSGISVLGLGIGLLLANLIWGLKCLAALRDELHPFTGTVAPAKVPAWLRLAVVAAATLGLLLVLCTFTYFAPGTSSKIDRPDDTNSSTRPAEFRERRLNSVSPD